MFIIIHHQKCNWIANNYFRISPPKAEYANGNQNINSNPTYPKGQGPGMYNHNAQRMGTGIYNKQFIKPVASNNPAKGGLAAPPNEQKTIKDKTTWERVVTHMILLQKAFPIKNL